jgi:endo-1,4-beta-xylanase
MNRPKWVLRLVTAGCFLPAGCGSSDLRPQAEPALKEVFAEAFMVGAALNPAQYHERDERAAELVRTQFNTITPENSLKWERVHPRPGEFTFQEADRFVEFGTAAGMFMVGHTLVWHSQTPRWVFQDAEGGPLDREALLERMRDHIHTVVGRYRGRIHGWDVVNEALNEDGTLRRSPWLEIIGQDYLEHAFRFAHEADPEAELYYNDYSLENAPKRAGAVALVRKLQAAGLPVHGIGTQGHYKMDWPTPAQVDSTIVAFADLGVHVMITELDVDLLPPAGDYRGADVGYQAETQERLDPYRGGLPHEMQHALALRYAELFDVMLQRRDVITRVTFWGVTDGDSWLNNWPVRGRTSYPLLFDRDGQAKPAFHAVVRAARSVASR